MTPGYPLYIANGPENRADLKQYHVAKAEHMDQQNCFWHNQGASIALGIKEATELQWPEIPQGDNKVYNGFITATVPGDQD